MVFRVALTFDAEHPDRPWRPGGTERVLEMLAARDCPASFFIQGRWAEAEPSVVRSIAGDGHLVGNHSHYHARMPSLTRAGLVADVRAAERVIRRLTGQDPRPWFRCPFGAGSGDPAIAAALQSIGYRDVGWDIDVADWRIAASGRGVARDVVTRTVAHGDAAVILLHPWTTTTGIALPAIIEKLRATGATFVRLDALA